MNDVEQRVARGMAVLDHFAPDWEFRVAPEDFTTIYRPEYCVLCAVFGSFNKGVNQIFGATFDGNYWSVTPGAESEYRRALPSIADSGFALRPVTAGRDEDNRLVDAWRSAIAARRSAVTLEPAHVEAL